MALHPLTPAASPPPPPAAAVAPLLDICLDALARSMPLAVAPSGSTLPAERLAKRLYRAYIRLDHARRHARMHSPARHLAAMRQLAALWQPSVLLLKAPAVGGGGGGGGQAGSMCSCHELAVFADSLAHLELDTTAAWLSGLAGLHQLTCLSLRNCANLTTAAVQAALPGLPQLAALDLCGLAAATDALAPALVALTKLRALRLNHTSCSDTTVECLTYGQRLAGWSAQQQRQQRQRQHQQGVATPVPPSSSEAQQAAWLAAQWPRTRIVSWQLAYSRVTPRAAELLACCEQLELVDLRGSGVRASQLVPLRTTHALTAPQGAVLSRSAAMALAAVTLDQFVCAAPAEHSAAAAAAAAATTGAHHAGQPLPPPAAPDDEELSQHVVNTGAEALLAAAAEAAQASRIVA